MTKKRDAYFDNAKFFLILAVVIGHMIEPLIGGRTLKPLYMFIYLFHMPLFVFISGFFSKNISSGDYAKKVISKLVIPYFIFESLYSIFDYWIFKRESLVFSYLTPYWIMWFLFSMILWKVLLPYVIKIRYALVVSILLAILAGYANDIGYYASLSRTIVFFPFFLAGYYFDKRYLEKLFTIKFRVIAALVVITVFFALYQYGQGIQVQWFYGSYSYAGLGHKEWYAGIYRIGIFALTVIISVCVLSFVPSKRIPLVSDMGARTIYVYLLHGFIMRYLISKNIYQYFDTTIEKAGLILMGIVITILLSFPVVMLTTRVAIEPNIKRIYKDA